MLVGLLRAPTQYDPFLNPEAARERRNEVLQNLVDRRRPDPGAGRQVQGHAGLAGDDRAAAGQGGLRERARQRPERRLLLRLRGQLAARPQGGHRVAAADRRPEDRHHAGRRSCRTACSSKLSSRHVDQGADDRDHAGRRPAAPATCWRWRRARSTARPDATGRLAADLHLATPRRRASTYKLFPLLTALSTGVPTRPGS